MLCNLLRTNTNSNGVTAAKTLTETYLPCAAKMRLIPSFVIVGLLLALSGCGSEAVKKPPAVRQSLTFKDPCRQSAAAVASGPADLIVDHAWVQDAISPEEQAAERKVMEALRAKVLAGESFIAGWEAFGVDGMRWHVAEQEVYPAEVVPECARNLPVGSVSAILPGDGGLHLFRILGREAVKQ